jgi:hypothetical protein
MENKFLLEREKLKKAYEGTASIVSAYTEITLTWRLVAAIALTWRLFAATVKFEKLKKDMEDTMESKMSNKGEHLFRRDWVSIAANIRQLPAVLSSAKKTHLMNLAIRDELDSQVR